VEELIRIGNLSKESHSVRRLALCQFFALRSLLTSSCNEQLNAVKPPDGPHCEFGLLLW
jgi:hypothetical protein